MNQALVDEIFSSVQGEGPSAGERHIFIRFLGCDLRCRYCDTPETVKSAPGADRSCRVQTSLGTFDRELVPNPLSGGQITAFCERLRIRPGPSRQVLSLTGGEPLLQTDFLLHWLPDVRRSFRIYLETNGIGTENLRTVAGLIDVVSMDIKLPSATGQAPRWDDHGEFLRVASAGAVFVKVVVTATTTLEDLRTAAELVARERRTIPFIIQPTAGHDVPSASRLLEIQAATLALLDDVRVIPQLHRMLQVP